MTHPLPWTHATTEVGENGLKATRSATQDERAHLVNEFGLLSCDALEAAYSLKATGAGRYRLLGRVTARIAQACVVSLDPIAVHIDEAFDVEFVPDTAPTGDVPAGHDQDILSVPDSEPIIAGRIDAGRIVFDTVSAAIDPYPRKAGADFGWTDPKAADAPANPFAVLKDLKRDP
jgi:uncharacterized metal-binding protein YceD (DUF177 family)